MNYFSSWYREFISPENKVLLVSIIATGVIAPVTAYITKEIINRIRKK